MLVAVVGRKLFQAFAAVVGASVVVFILTHLIGDPVRVMLPIDATQVQYVAMRHRLGLDHPLSVQLVNYFADVLRGHFGESIWQQRPAFELALDHVPPTAELAFAGILVSALLGIPAGFLAATHQGKMIDQIVNAWSIASISIANFWLALMLILVFSVELRWLPTSGGGFRGLILPTLAVAAAPFGRLAQMSRAAMIEELGRPYVLAARARGMSVHRAVLFHATRNALIPIVTLGGFEFAALFGGHLVIIETIFSRPGLGYLTYQALNHRDFPLIQACVFVIVMCVIFINFAVDIFYTVIDPRVRT